MGVDWIIWGLVLSDDIPDGLAEIRRWSWADVMEAYAVLDALTEIREIRKARSDARTRE